MTLMAVLGIFAGAMLAAVPPTPGPIGYVDDDALGLKDIRQLADEHARSGGGTAGVARSLLREYWRGFPCEVDDSPVSASCAPGEAVPIITCADGETVRVPLWMREEIAPGEWGSWSLVSMSGCDDDAALLAAVEREWTELVPAPSVVTLQPSGGTVYGTVPTIAIAGEESRTHAATLLGASVTIVATPVEYAWDWGDGERTVTEDPGRPYPDQTVSHAYGHAVDEATVTLTTTWSGRWRVGTGAWHDFADTVTSTSPTITLTVLHPRAVLVG